MTSPARIDKRASMQNLVSVRSDPRLSFNPNAEALPGFAILHRIQSTGGVSWRWPATIE
jgi:hypothetical protein